MARNRKPKHRVRNKEFRKGYSTKSIILLFGVISVIVSGYYLYINLIIPKVKNRIPQIEESSDRQAANLFENKKNSKFNLSQTPVVYENGEKIYLLSSFNSLPKEIGEGNSPVISKDSSTVAYIKHYDTPTGIRGEFAVYNIVDERTNKFQITEGLPIEVNSISPKNNYILIHTERYQPINNNIKTYLRHITGDVYVIKTGKKVGEYDDNYFVNQSAWFDDNTLVYFDLHDEYNSTTKTTVTSISTLTVPDARTSLLLSPTPSQQYIYLGLFGNILYYSRSTNNILSAKGYTEEYWSMNLTTRESRRVTEKEANAYTDEYLTTLIRSNLSPIYSQSEIIRPLINKNDNKWILFQLGKERDSKIYVMNLENAQSSLKEIAEGNSASW